MEMRINLESFQVCAPFNGQTNTNLHMKISTEMIRNGHTLLTNYFVVEQHDRSQLRAQFYF